MRGRRPRGGAAHHPTCGRRLAPQRAQAAPRAAARRALAALAALADRRALHALQRVRERERQLGRRVVPVKRHGSRLRRRCAIAREQRRYFRLYRDLEHVRRRRLILDARHPRDRQFLPGGRRVLRVNLLPRHGRARPRRGGVLARRRQVVDAAERQPDLTEHLGVVGLLVAVSYVPLSTRKR